MESNVVKRFIIPGLSLLPYNLNTPQARAMLAAIGLQKSGFEHRKQIGGPARGFWQFEKSGVAGVLSHPATAKMIADVCKRILIPPYTDLCYGAIAYHDALACCFARLLLYTYPAPLPAEGDIQEAWNQYQAIWSPDEQRPGTFAGFFEDAWRLVKIGD